MTIRSDWNVWVGDGCWRKVAVVAATDGEIHQLAAWLRGAGECFDMRLAAWESGTLEI